MICLVVGIYFCNRKSGNRSPRHEWETCRVASLARYIMVCNSRIPPLPPPRVRGLVHEALAQGIPAAHSHSNPPPAPPRCNELHARTLSHTSQPGQLLGNGSGDFIFRLSALPNGLGSLNCNCLAQKKVMPEVKKNGGKANQIPDHMPLFHDVAVIFGGCFYSVYFDRLLHFKNSEFSRQQMAFHHSPGECVCMYVSPGISFAQDQG